MNDIPMGGLVVCCGDGKCCGGMEWGDGCVDERWQCKRLCIQLVECYDCCMMVLKHLV